MELFDQDVLREVGNGVWTMLGLFLIVALLYTLYGDIRNRPDWYKDRGTALVIGTLVYFCGSILRSTYIWVGLVAGNRGWEDDVLEEWRIAALVAIVFGVVGGLCIIRVCLVDRFGPWAWILSGLISVAVPVGVHIFI